jgi:hypothetical protein
LVRIYQLVPDELKVKSGNSANSILDLAAMWDCVTNEADSQTQSLLLFGFRGNPINYLYLDDNIPIAVPNVSIKL